MIIAGGIDEMNHFSETICELFNAREVINDRRVTPNKREICHNVPGEIHLCIRRVLSRMARLHLDNNRTNSSKGKNSDVE